MTEHALSDPVAMEVFDAFLEHVCAHYQAAG